MQRSKKWLLQLGGAIAGVSMLLSASVGRAADEVVFRYGIFRQRLSVIELTNFAEKGEMSPVVERYLKRTNSNPEEVRRILNKPIAMSRGTLNTALKNPLGNMVLDELGGIIRTPDNTDNREALRIALLQSAQKNNQLTILSMIQNYPTDEIHLDVKQAIRTYERVSKIQKPVQNILEKIGPLRDLLK